MKNFLSALICGISASCSVAGKWQWAYMLALLAVLVFLWILEDNIVRVNQLESENELLKKSVILRQKDSVEGWGKFYGHRKKIEIAIDRVGPWMSAALDDPKVCVEMKNDIKKFFSTLNSLGMIKDKN